MHGVEVGVHELHVVRPALIKDASRALQARSVHVHDDRSGGANHIREHEQCPERSAADIDRLVAGANAQWVVHPVYVDHEESSVDDKSLDLGSIHLAAGKVRLSSPNLSHSLPSAEAACSTSSAARRAPSRRPRALRFLR